MTLKEIQDMNLPFTGRIEINPPIRAKIRNTEKIRHFFDGSKDYVQVTDITMDKTYEIYAVEGFGDVSDVFIKDDNGNEKELISDWFEEVDMIGCRKSLHYMQL